MEIDALIDFATRLEELVVTLTAAIADPEHHTAPVKLDGSLGRLARMDDMQSQQMALAAQRRNLQQLASVKAALQRIEKGIYGRCIQCGSTISANRLNALPDAALCLKCAAQASP